MSTHKFLIISAILVGFIGITITEIGCAKKPVQYVVYVYAGDRIVRVYDALNVNVQSDKVIFTDVVRNTEVCLPRCGDRIILEKR